MIECFHAITIDAKRLHCRCEQYCIILRSRNKSFSRNPFEFLHIRESPVSRSSNVSSIEARGSSLEVQVSSVNLLLSGTVCLQVKWRSSIESRTVSKFPDFRFGSQSSKKQKKRKSNSDTTQANLQNKTKKRKAT